VRCSVGGRGNLRAERAGARDRLGAALEFQRSAGSEQRFRDALATSTGDDALILQTQIARTYGLRNDFPKAREILRGIEPELAFAGAEARARHALETGRTYASAAHPAASTGRRCEGARPRRLSRPRTTSR
jgi:hypothetical protein